MAIKLKLNPVGRYAEVIVNNGKPKIFNPTSLTAYNVASDGLTISVFPGKLLWAEVQIDGVAPTSWADFKDKFGEAFPNPNSGSGGSGTPLTSDNEDWGITIDDTDPDVPLIGVEKGTELITGFESNPDLIGWVPSGTGGTYTSTSATQGILKEKIGLIGGSGYAVDDVLTFPSGDGNAQITVTAVDGGGFVTDYDITDQGTSYSFWANSPIYLPLSGGSGSGIWAYLTGVTNRIMYSYSGGGAPSPKRLYQIEFTVTTTGDGVTVYFGFNSETFTTSGTYIRQWEYAKYAPWGNNDSQSTGPSTNGSQVIAFEGHGDNITISDVSVRQLYDKDVSDWSLDKVIGAGSDADGYRITGVAPAIDSDNAVSLDQISSREQYSNFSAWLFGNSDGFTGWSLNPGNEAYYDGNTTGPEGRIIQWSLIDAGTGYAVDDVLDFDYAPGSGAQITVDSVDGGGAITSYTLTNAGGAYPHTYVTGVLTPGNFSGGTGSGATFSIERVGHNRLWLANNNQSDKGRYRVKVVMNSEIAFQVYLGEQLIDSIGPGIGDYFVEGIYKGPGILGYTYDGETSKLSLKPTPGTGKATIKRVEIVELPHHKGHDVQQPFFNRYIFNLELNGSSDPTNRYFDEAGLGSGGSLNWKYIETGIIHGRKPGWLSGNLYLNPRFLVLPTGLLANESYMVKLSKLDISTLKIEMFDTDWMTPFDIPSPFSLDFELAVYTD